MESEKPSGDNPHRWCFFHKRLEPLDAKGQLSCPQAWSEVRRSERDARTEQDARHPENLLREIKDAIVHLTEVLEDVLDTPPPDRPTPKREAPLPRPTPPKNTRRVNL